MYSVHVQCLAGKVGAAKNNKCSVLLECGLWGFSRLFGRVGSRQCEDYSSMEHSIIYVPLRYYPVFGLGRSPHIQLSDLDISAVFRTLSSYSVPITPRQVQAPGR